MPGPSAGAALAGRPPTPRSVLALQRLAGNRVVGAQLRAGTHAQRSPDPTGSSAGGTAVAPVGRAVGTYARVAPVSPYLSVKTDMDPRRVEVLPDPLVATTLDFNDRVLVLVLEEYPGGWARVRTDDGVVGYTWSRKLFTGAPDPGARLHLIESGETALGLAQRYYDCGEWGRDGRFFVNVLVRVNQGSGSDGARRGIHQTGGGPDDAIDSWRDAQLRSDHWIWIPGEDFARSLAGTVSSGSVSYELWEGVAGVAAFLVGVFEGIGQALVDLVTGLVDLAAMLIDLVVDIARDGLAAKVEEIVAFFEGLDPAAIASALWSDFVTRWTAEDPWERWKFRGMVTGMVIAEIALAVLTGGAAVALRAAGQGGRLARLASRLADLGAVRRVAHGIDQAGDATDVGRRARRALREPHGPPDRLGADLDRSFRDTFTEPDPDLGPGHHGPAVEPETAAGFTRAQVAGFQRLLGKPFTHADTAALARVWDAAARPGDIALLRKGNSRALFDLHRARFWRAVRADADATKLFTDAGCTFPSGPTSAPVLNRPDGSRIQMTIDHIEERQTAFTRALDPANLRISFRRENTQVLRLINQLDPFQR